MQGRAHDSPHVTARGIGTVTGAPAITAVIPTYNRAALVVRAVESVLAQSRPPDEIIVVDDGSTDDTVDRLRQFSERVRCISQANAGGAAARNHGVEAATGGWIAFLDSDDLWPAGHLAVIDRAIRETAGAAIMYFGDGVWLGPGGETSLWREAQFAPDAPWQVAADGAPWVLMRRQPMILPSAVIQKDAYLAVGGLRPGMIRRHDTDLFLRLGLCGALCAVAEAGALVTADDTTDVRLTTSFDGRSRVYWECTATMYRDAAAMPGIGRRHRQELVRRLGDAHWRLSRLAWTQDERTSAVAHVGRSFAVSPGRFVHRVTRRAGLRRPGRAPA